MTFEFFVTCPKGSADLLSAELTRFGAANLKERAGGVACTGDLAVGYRAILWSRVANRVLLVLSRFQAIDSESLYAGVREIPWLDHLGPEHTLAIDAVTSDSALTHSQFIAQRTKDAIADQLREQCGARPSVDTANPDLRVHVHLARNQAQVALDLGGESLHRRGYRAAQGAAPLKENLAAALLLRAHWPALATQGAPLLDPMCGAGTLLIEGALIAANIAPGLLRGNTHLTRWRQHDAETWEALCADARAQRVAVPASPLMGFDVDPRVVAIARDNVAAAGLSELIHIEQRAIKDATAIGFTSPGLIACNPPYGERLGSRDSTADLYRSFGAQLRAHFQGWEAALLIGPEAPGGAFGIKAHRTHRLYNGALECTLLRMTVVPAAFMLDAPAGTARVLRARQRIESRGEPSPGAAMFANRIQKNLRALARWASREQITCYRLYDADMPEYALAIDIFEGEERWLHVQEYAAPRTIAEDKARQRLDDALAQLPELLEVPPERVVFKRREKQHGTAQYERRAGSKHFFEVTEGGHKFLVNLRDYLDTGLFLDHRLTRRRLRELAPERDVLNLFAYTASASVYAAAGGARSTASIDMSATYCDWARRNLALNGFGLPRHEVLQTDCLAWLAERPTRQYGLIFLDPPTFSNSKRMHGTLDVQRDHVQLIQQCLARLTPDGVLVFSTNLRSFKLDRAALANFEITDRSRATLPEDFKRDARIHQCFEIRQKGRVQ